MDEFLESLHKSASFLEESLNHLDSSISSLEESLLINENEERLGSLINKLSGIYDDIESEASILVDSADEIKDIVFKADE